MAGFFANIKNRPVGGRFFTLLLRELAFQGKTERRAFAKIFGLSGEQCGALLKEHAQIEKEWLIPNGSRKIADLAVLIGGEPILLIEVKEEELNNPANEAQVENYVNYIRERKKMTSFVHVSRYSPANHHEEAIQRAKHEGLPVRSLRYRNIYDGLSDETPFCRRLRDYFEDIGVASYQTFNIDDSRVRFFLVHSLGLKYKHGLGKLYSNDAVNEIPEFISKMFNNLEVIAEWIQESNRQSIPQRFARRYVPVQEFELKALGRALSKNSEEIGELPGRRGQFVESGTMYFYAEGAIKSKRWLRLELDVGLNMDPTTRDKPVTMELSVGFFSYGLNPEPEYASNILSSFPTEVVRTEAFLSAHQAGARCCLEIRYQRPSSNGTQEFCRAALMPNWLPGFARSRSDCSVLHGGAADGLNG